MLVSICGYLGPIPVTEHLISLPLSGKLERGLAHPLAQDEVLWSVMLEAR